MSDAEEASQPVSDEELDRAADEAVDEVAEVAEEATEEEVVEEESEESGEEEEAEEEQEEEIPAEPDAEKENAERSKLGRKVKELEELVERQSAESNEKLAKALEIINKLTAKEEPEEEDDFIMPETKSDLQKLIDEALEKKEQASKSQEVQRAEQYTKDYVDTMKDLVADEEDDIRDEILARLKTEEFNVRHSDNGSRDAAKNIKNVIKSLAVKKKEIPLKGEKPRAPLGGGGKDKVPARELKLPKLSAEAKEFIAATGMSEAEAAEALSGEAPAYIRA